MGIDTTILSRLHEFLRFQPPALRIKLTALTSRRLIDLQVKKIERDPEFNRKYKYVILPYWKKYGVKPYKNSYKVLCPKGKDADPRFIPDNIWFSKILKHYNNVIEYRNLGDKSLQGLLVKGINAPKTILKSCFGVMYDGDFNPVDNDHAIAICRKSGEIIVKQSWVSCGGNGVEFLDTKNMSDSDILKVFNQRKEDFIVQEVLKQHKVLSDINNNSVNTVRIITFYHKGEVHILSSVLRMGSGESKVDNIMQGGFACKIHEDGRLDKYAVSRKSSWNTVHPGGTVFEDVVIPNYAKMIAQIKEVAKRVPYFKILGWDLAIDEDGNAAFIEFNAMPEQNQKTCGPTFGDMTDEILSEVFLNK
ncbi:MAG: hypothetical protein K6F76_01310 [Clostridiales bacterium]|nr:hypothetical protein [Clostridiales bacterium]